MPKIMLKSRDSEKKASASPKVNIAASRRDINLFFVILLFLLKHNSSKKVGAKGTYYLYYFSAMV
ncbi:hypothetical protein D3C73_801980 [compost metagenome]